MRGPIFTPEYRPQFTGHETFPLRYGWLKKVWDEVAGTQDEHPDNKYIFLADDAIARFGVGKNMVSSMRHWATALKIIEERQDGPGFRTTSLGNLLLSDKGADPYMENPATTWLLHWLLCHPEHKTTWHWAFNYFALGIFEREQLVQSLLTLAQEREWTRASRATVKRDVECFIRAYAARPPNAKSNHEDSLESPFSELGLIQPTGKRDGFRLVRGSKRGLSRGVFAFAVDMFWKSYSSAQTISFEALAHQPGSPGRVFLLSEDDLAGRLMEID
ncbi:MAG: DUF4007 family protein, partial [Oceanococcus sp.]